MKNKKYLGRCIALWSLLLVCFTNVKSQEVLMQGWYWDYPKTAAGENWTDTLNSKLADLSTHGVTHIWLPPMTRSSFGNNSNGYDPKDLYDLGEYGLGPTGLGTKAQLDVLISNIQTNGMKAVADVVYNHRDGGKAENNSAVEGWIENYNCTKRNNGDNPYPSDRFRYILPLGGASLNGAGTYYFKIASASKHIDFYNKPYTFYTETNTVGYQNLAANTESEPNGGGDCVEGNNTVQLGRDMSANVDSYGSDCYTGSCGSDEFALTISSGDFNPSGDTLYIYTTNPGGNYSDHFIYGLWNEARDADVQGELKYQTYTDFTALPSGRGQMNYTNFKPNGNPTNLGGDWDAMLFFYDYDQAVATTRDTLIDWTKWLVDEVHIEGLRMDAVKHFDYNFVSDLLDSLYLEGTVLDMVVGESFDFDPYVLKNWVENVENNMLPAAASAYDVKVFDFALRGALKNASDLFGYDARSLFNAGIVDGAGGNKNQAVTFVNNHDFRGAGEPILNNPELGYAYILTNPNIGTPTIFYPDYYGTDLPEGPDAKLKGDIDILLDIKKEYIDGSNNTIYISESGGSYPNPLNYKKGFPTTSVIYEVVNATTDVETIVAINYAGDTLEVEFKWDKQLTGSGYLLNERTGKGLNPTILVPSDSIITLVVPPRSYGIWNTDDVASPCGFNEVVYVDINANGHNNGSSWEDAFTSLHSAMRLPYVCTDVDEIWVKEGDYKPGVIGDRNENFHILSAVKLYGGFPQSMANPSFLDRDWINYPTILNADIGASSESDNTYHVLSNYTSSDTSVVDGFILKNGNANGPSLSADGAGIINFGNLSLSNVSIVSCKAVGNGSAINNSEFSKMILENVTTETNTSSTSQFYNAADSDLKIKTNASIKE